MRRTPSISFYVAAILAATIGVTPAFAGSSTVTIENFTFKPDVITIHAGTVVTFKNVDDIPHSIVMADGSFHSKALDTDDQIAVPFAKPGDYTYFCGLHPHMQGKVTVIP